jgi:uncharacterized RDD family membrane protein YckC
MASTGDSRYAPPTASVADVAPTQGAAPLASRWRRLGAYIIDALLMVAAAALIARLAHWNLFDPASLRRPHVNMLIGVSAFMLLNGYLLVTRGQTIAKASLGMRIVRPDGGEVSAFRILGLRYGIGYLANLVPVVGALFGLIDCLLIFRQSRRCLHDQIADTIVIRD